MKSIVFRICYFIQGVPWMIVQRSNLVLWDHNKKIVHVGRILHQIWAAWTQFIQWVIIWVDPNAPKLNLTIIKIEQSGYGPWSYWTFIFLIWSWTTKLLLLTTIRGTLIQNNGNQISVLICYGLKNIIATF